MDRPFNGDAFDGDDAGAFEHEPSTAFLGTSKPTDAGLPAGGAALAGSTRGIHPSTQPHTGKPQAETDERGSVITARGTAEGLVLRIDGRVDYKDLLTSTREFLESRRTFLSGHDVAFEWVGKKPDEVIVQEVTAILSSEFQVSVRSSRLRTPSARPSEIEVTEGTSVQPPAGLSVLTGSALTGGRSKTGTAPAVTDKAVSLFDGIEGFDSRASGSSSMLWDDPDARIIYGTLRSGQKVETEHSIVVFGDVNSGAEVIAGGDIVILGTLRGIAHAGAYDESGGGRVIFSLNLQPTQLRIGLVISRGGGESSGRGSVSEVARVENNMIVVEPYQSRTVWVRRRE
jgi:septum formation inhibitor MinC